MENKSFGVVIALCAGVLAAAALLVSVQKASELNVNVNGASQEKVGANAGEITYWISGDFSDDLNVQGTLTTAGLEITGNVTSTSVATSKVTSFTGSASSQTLCAIRNTSGADRVLVGADLVYATSSVTGGTYDSLTISQSSTASATGTSPDLYYSNTISVPTNGINNLTSTSTLYGTGGARAIWKSNNYMNFLIGSPTSTLSGNCRVLSY